MTTERNERDALKDAKIKIDYQELKPAPPKPPNPLIGTFEIGDISDFHIPSEKHGLGDANFATYGGKLGEMFGAKEK